MANSLDPGQMLQNAASDLGLQFAPASPTQYLGLLWYLKKKTDDPDLN